MWLELDTAFATCKEEFQSDIPGNRGTVDLSNGGLEGIRLGPGHQYL